MSVRKSVAAVVDTDAVITTSTEAASPTNSPAGIYVPRRRFSTVSTCSVSGDQELDEQADKLYRRRLRDKIAELTAYVRDLETRSAMDLHVAHAENKVRNE